MKRERRVINACGEVSDGQLKVLMVDIKERKSFSQMAHMFIFSSKDLEEQNRAIK